MLAGALKHAAELPAEPYAVQVAVGSQRQPRIMNDPGFLPCKKISDGKPDARFVRYCIDTVKENGV